MTTLMIVDDHRHIVEDLATTIPWSAHGVDRVLQAYSGPEALERLDREPVDIVVTDIRMPAMSGLELIREIGTRSPATSCLLLTGHAEFEYARAAIEFGAAGYLLKPVRHEELVAAVNRIAAERAEKEAQAAETMRMRDMLQVELPRMKAELLAARTDAAQAAEAERDRIVGDIHDIVGYALTAMIVQLEAAGKQLLTDREAGIERLEQSRRFARRSLDDIRETLGQLRNRYPGYNDEDGDSPSDLEGLIERFVQGAEQAVNITVERNVRLPDKIAEPALIKALMNALQEGITNGVRHGGAGKFRLSLEEVGGDELRFELWNDGIPFDDAYPGNGLSIMSERIGRLGGRTALAATRHPDGTRLSILLPSARRTRVDDA
ncbi:response regulator [Paenibacillaceae bacterium WGS1546]|uniref:response regulator n=1 Tax=Cohnella sp. WGS1546 TaxID=3366810 RepID=UPI00372D0053